jgi:hypothetical protein
MAAIRSPIGDVRTSSRRAGVQKLVLYFISLSALTVLAGTALFWTDSGGNLVGFVANSRMGLAFAVGRVAAWIAFFLGLLGVKPTIEEVGAAGEAMNAAGGPPTPAMVARMEGAQSRLALLGQVDLVLSIAVISMAIARYL